MSSDNGVINDAVLTMLKTRKTAITSGLSLMEEWSVQVPMSDEIGYEIFIKEDIFFRYAEKNATESMIVKSLVTFIFGLIEENLGNIQVSSKMVS